MNKPNFITDDEWNDVFPADRSQVVSIAASLFRKGYAKRESFFLAKEIFEAQMYGKLISQSVSEMFLDWVKFGFNPSGSEIHQSILFGKLVKDIYLSSQAIDEGVLSLNEPLREIWKNVKWSFPSNYCVCCFEKNNDNSLIKSGFLIHQDCIDLFSVIAKDLSKRVMSEIENKKMRGLQGEPSVDVEITNSIPFEEDEDMEFIAKEEPALENHAFLNIFD